ncbi:hypothetical protein EV363DRAFT_221053 [Boletus edulis]|nr:hypothetical protein EV363DRAFT_221053 [Boletus edulis]
MVSPRPAAKPADPPPSPFLSRPVLNAEPLKRTALLDHHPSRSRHEIAVPHLLYPSHQSQTAQSHNSQPLPGIYWLAKDLCIDKADCRPIAMSESCHQEDTLALVSSEATVHLLLSSLIGVILKTEHGVTAKNRCRSRVCVLKFPGYPPTLSRYQSNMLDMYCHSSDGNFQVWFTRKPTQMQHIGLLYSVQTSDSILSFLRKQHPDTAYNVASFLR